MKQLRTIVSILCLSGWLLAVFAAGLTVTATSGISSPTAAVMWITNSANILQQTFAIWSKRNDDHLKVWRAASGNVVSVDAVSSATLSSKATFSGTWNLKGADGNIVPNGTYKYWIEICQDGPTPYHAVGSIVIDGTSKTKAGTDSSNSATALTNINAVYTAPAVTTNSPPVITNPDTVGARIGTTTIWTALATDPNNDPVTFTFSGQASWITVSNATLTMNPTESSQNDTVTAIASDGKGGLDTLKLKIKVYNPPAVNVPPVISNPDTVSAKIGATTTWTALATDANGDGITFSFSGQASWITVSNATLIMNPTTTSKNDTVTVIAADGKTGFDTLKLKITVFSPPLTNVPPVFTNPDTVTARIGSIVTWTAHATDANGDAVSYSFTGLPSWITASNATITMGPSASSKNTTVNVYASDGKGGLDTLALKISVFNPSAINAPPVITSASSVNAPVGSITKWIAAATDPNGDSILFSFKKLPLTPTAWYSFSLDTLIIIPDPTSVSCTTIVIASDSKGAADTLFLRINVVPGAKVINQIDIQKGNKISIGAMTFPVPPNAGKSLTVSLFTCNGVKVWSRFIRPETANEFSLAGLKSGMYLLTIRTQTSNSAYKIIVGK